MKSLFSGKKVATNRVRQELGLVLELLLWQITADFAHEDPFLIFHIDGRKIKVSQEQPAREKIYRLNTAAANSIDNLENLHTKVWAIDNEEYCVLLFPNEY